MAPGVTLEDVRSRFGAERTATMIAACEERLRLHPEDVRTSVEIGRALCDMGLPAKALHYWKLSLDRHPGHPQLRELIQRYSLRTGSGRRLGTSGVPGRT